MDSIAVIGIALRLHGAETPTEFWHRLIQGRESLQQFSDDELQRAGVPPAIFNNPSYVRSGGVLDRAEEFDAEFFGITPRSAELMDPQHRVFVELAWEALEDAAVVPGDRGPRIGVYAGSSQTSWLASLGCDADRDETLGAFQTAISTGQDFLTTRVSYTLDLTGPSISVQTACSTSLVAVCLACDALFSYQTDIAVAGGVAIRFPQERGYVYEPGMIYSPDGHCRPFDRQAQGCVGSNGAGVVVLKRLAEALENRDPIRAVIRGWAINNDGSRRVGYTAPSAAGQARVIGDALRLAAVDPDTIGFVEAHGTGTPLGDSVEIAALTEVYRAHSARRQSCAIGSVKSSFGHLDAAAGAIGLIKAVLALEHRRVPPTLHFHEANPALRLDDSPFFVNTETIEWRGSSTPRRAAVSAFGIGGTNAHVVLEEAAPQPPPAEGDRWQVLLVSARTPTALEASTRRLADHIAGGAPLCDVAFTLQTGRQRFAYRRAVLCRDTADAIAALTAADVARPSPGPPRSAARVAFLFPGGSAQYAGMAAGLYRAYPVFTRAVDECCEQFAKASGQDILGPMFTASDESSVALRRGMPGLAALFTVEVALCRLLDSWGVKPHVMLGHSLGEYAAATMSGVMSLGEAASLVALRAQLLDGLSGGAMSSVALSERELRASLDGELAIAAVNGPSLCVVSGAAASVAAFEAKLARRGVETHRLHSDVAGHSSTLDPVLDEFERAVGGIQLRPPRIPFISGVSGDWIRPHEATDPAYWRRQLREPVRFADGLGLLRQSSDVMLEVGPGTALSTLAGDAAVPTLRHPLDVSRADEAHLLTAVGRLWIEGVEFNWDELHAPMAPRRISLPAYPFERRRYVPAPSSIAHQHVLPPDEWFHLPQWKLSVSPAASAPDSDGVVLVFGAGDSVAGALARGFTERGSEVHDVRAAGHDPEVAGPAIAIRPDVAADYEQLLRRFGDRPLRIVHCWTADLGQRTFDAAQRVGYHSLVALAGALARYPSPVRLDVVSRGVHGIGGAPAIPANATLLGPCTVMPQELNHVVCRSIDLAEVPADGDADAVFSEVVSACGDRIVAYRGRQRFVRTFERLRVRPAASALVRRDGVYAITGAGGEIGLFLAESFARTAPCRLALIMHRPPTGDARILEALDRMRAAGAEAFVEVADVSDGDALCDVRARIESRFGAINGLVHSAGTTKGRSVLTPTALLTPDDAEAQFRAKVRGVLALDRAFGDAPLDFCVLMSSNASVLGGAGLAAYAAANAFMDAFASARAARGAVPWISAGWDGWRVGAYAVPGAARTSIDRFAMSPQECFDALCRLAASGLRGHVVVSRGELGARLAPQSAQDAPPELFARPATAAAADGGRGSAVPGTMVEEQIARIWEEQLGVASIHATDNFFDLGGQSLLGLRVAARVRSAFDVDVTLRTLFEQPTVAAMARHVTAVLEERAKSTEMQTLVDELERLTEAEAEDLLSHD